jgi:hypothetical protein
MDLWTASFSRHESLPGARMGTAAVTAATINEVGHRPSVHIMVSVSRSSIAAIRVMRVLEASGYARSKYSRSYCVTKMVRPVSLAVRECARVVRMFAHGE